jgi:hypothetical protein
MKRILLLTALLLGAAGLHAQSKATAVVSLTTGMTAKLELNNTTTTATLTLTGPSDRWLALQIGSFTNSGGMQEGADVVYWNGTTLIDANQNGVGAFPSVDTNDWTSSSTVSGTTRTIVATRAFSTGSSDDFTFVYSDINVDFAWAKASSATNTLNAHGSGNRGYSLNNAYTCVAPTAPTSSAQTFCSGATVASLVATGQPGATFKWYAAATGGNALASTAVLTSTNYFVSQTVGDCESTRTSTAVTVTTVPLPTASEAQSFCSESHVSNLVASGQAGATLSWYNVATGGDALPGTTLLVAGNYYVSQTVGGCTSNRKLVVVSFTTLAAPNVPNETATACSGSTIAGLTVTGMAGATFTWYENETGGSAIPTSTVLVDGADYYVTQTVGSCVSSRRKVIINIDEVQIPVAEHNQSVCTGATIGALAATGVEGAVLTWHKPQDGPALGENTVLEAGVYYVKQTINGCTSGVKEVIVALLPAPAAPSGPEIQQFEQGETVSDLLIGINIGAGVQWYIMVEGNLQLIGADHLLEDGVDYYVTQTQDGCESAPHKITADEVLGVPTFSLKNLAVYPNPVVDVLTVSYNEPIAEVALINMLGQVVIIQKVNADKVEVNTSKLQSGSYILKVTTAKGGATVKIVK